MQLVSEPRMYADCNQDPARNNPVLTALAITVLRRHCITLVGENDPPGDVDIGGNASKADEISYCTYRHQHTHTS